MLPAGTRTLVVAGAVVDNLDSPSRLLAARRAAPTSLAGRWEFPGGKLEPGEAPQAALERELLEELGVRVRLGAEHAGPDDGAWVLSEQYMMRLWLVTVVSGEPAPLVEHDELAWLPLGSWLDLPWLDADVRIVESLQARYLAGGGRGLGVAAGGAEVAGAAEVPSPRPDPVP